MPRLFDLVVAAIFAPFGGAQKLRTDALDLANVSGGTRVLELGCGTGGITALMLERGAVVHAIDGSRRMLDRALSVAPGARFEQMQLENLSLHQSYDVALVAFVLHELPAAVRVTVLAQSLAVSSRVAILDHALPRSGLRALAWRQLLLAMEPPTVRDCIERGYGAEIESAGGRMEAIHVLAGGTAALTLAVPA